MAHCDQDSFADTPQDAKEGSTVDHTIAGVLDQNAMRVRLHLSKLHVWQMTFKEMQPEIQRSYVTYHGDLVCHDSVLFTYLFPLLVYILPISRYRIHN